MNVSSFVRYNRGDIDEEYDEQQKKRREREVEKYRLISAYDKNQECPITLCPIKKGHKYCICPTCNYNFNAEVIANIIKQTTLHLTCPLCRSFWSKQDTHIYINNQDPEEEIQDALSFAVSLINSK